MGPRYGVWLSRHPMVAVVVLLGIVAGITGGTAYLVQSPQQSPPLRVGVGEQVAPSTLPPSTQHPPANRVEDAHQALHSLGRACQAPTHSSNLGNLRKPLDIIEAFAKDYPNARFSIDDETGSTLALLIVVWHSLDACDPTLAQEVHNLIPAQYLDD